ncbi:MAG TPA: hypothetical protein QF764_08795 [Planctomycetota bacterium]|nr:hypothetical protein [Planctomycetota bacterium]
MLSPFTLLLLGLLAAPHTSPPAAIDAAFQDGQSEPSAADRLAALEAAFDQAMVKFTALYRAARTDEARDELFETSYPRAADWFERFMELAREDPGSPVALQAMLWVLRQRPEGEMHETVVAALFAGHIESEEMAGVCRLFERRMLDGARALTALIERSPHAAVRGHAHLSLAKNQFVIAEAAERYGTRGREQAVARYGEEGADLLKAADPDARRALAERRLELVVAEYGEHPHAWEGTLGARAGAILFELRRLQVGHLAPDIEGKDADGVTFKLSGHRGKVTVIDFWGHW